MDCLNKREQFAISLRKQKRSQILENKRRKNYEAAGLFATSVLLTDT
jgi:hypothetical protein